MFSLTFPIIMECFILIDNKKPIEFKDLTLIHSQK